MFQLQRAIIRPNFVLVWPDDGSLQLKYVAEILTFVKCPKILYIVLLT